MKRVTHEQARGIGLIVVLFALAGCVGRPGSSAHCVTSRTTLASPAVRAVCDGYDRTMCDNWASAEIGGGSAYSSCLRPPDAGLLGYCVRAPYCGGAGIGCSCGSDPMCGPGFACVP